MPVNQALPLRDIHLPASVSWWPPAPGWWLVVAMVLLTAAVAVFLYRRKQDRKLNDLAIQELQKIQLSHAQHLDDLQLIQALSIWLRRVCLSHYPRVDVAGLTGDSWLKFLDEPLSGTTVQNGFSEGAGRLLVTAPYQLSATVDATGLLELCHTWAGALPGFKERSQ